MTAGSFALPPVQGKAIHQGIDHLVGILMRTVSQVGIAGRGENTVVAEDFLHFQQIANSRRFRRHRLQSDAWRSCAAGCAGKSFF